MPAPDPPLLPPELAARYTPHRVLGRGGMGVVLAATDRELDRPVAIKRIQGEASPELLRRLRREASLLAELRHPGIVQLYSFVDHPDGLFLVMELLEGVSLAEVRDRERALRALADVAGALREVHAHGLVHRDVKPQNILCHADGRGVLIDFGLAHDDRRTRLTTEGQLVGTFAYLAPDLLRGAQASPAADWYGWAASLYQVLGDRHPYAVEDLLAYASRGTPLPPPLAPCEDLPPDVWPRLEELLRPTPEGRAGPPRTLERALRSWVARDAPRTSAGRPGGRSRGSLACLAGLALVLALALVGDWDLLSRPEPRVSARPSPPPATVPEARALDETFRELARPHRGDGEGESPGPWVDPRDPDHQEAVRSQLTDLRFPLRLRRLLAETRSWWESLPADRALLERERRSFRRLAAGLLPHLLDDLRILRERARPERAGLARLARQSAQANRALTEFEAELVQGLPLASIFGSPHGAQVLADLEGLLRVYPDGEVAALVASFRRRVLAGELPPEEVVRQAFLLARPLARSSLARRCAGAGDLVQLGLDAAGAAPATPSRAPLIQNLLLATAEFAAGCLGEEDSARAARFAARVPEVLSGGPAPAVPDRITASATLSLVHLLERRGDPRASRRLWWWLHKLEYLWEEPPEVRDLLGGPASPGPPLAQQLAGLRREPTSEAWGALLRGILEAVEADRLRASPAALGRLVRELQALRQDPRPEPPEVEALLLGALYRLERPLALPRHDRLLLEVALAGDLPFAPLWRMAWGYAPSGIELEGEDARLFADLFHPGKLGDPVLARLATRRSNRLPGGSCLFHQGRARGVQELPPSSEPTGLLETWTWWRLSDRLVAITDCLLRCPDTFPCVPDPGLLRAWLENIDPSLRPQVRQELVVSCRAALPGWRAPPEGADATSREILAGVQARCAEVGVDLRGP